MLKIWGRNTSINVQKVMWAIGELGIAHERINVGGAFGKNNEPAYLAMNPNGLVPTLEEDDFILWESNAIVRYLAAKYGASTLEPKDPRARASAGRWMDWQLSVTAPTIHPLFWGTGADAGGKARSSQDQRRQGQDHGDDEDPRRAARQDGVRRLR